MNSRTRTRARRPLPPRRAHRHRAAWARCGGPTTRPSTATSRSRCCAPTAPTTRASSSGSAPRPGTAAACSHPNIATVHDFGEEDGTAFLVMELLAGRAPVDPHPRARAAARRTRSPRSSTRRPSPCRPPTTRASSTATSSRPTSSSTTTATPSSPTSASPARLSEAPLTQTGEVLGTPHYLAPEQAQGEPAGPLSDVYALAVVGYEMLTGQRPFAGDSMVTTALAHVSQPAPQLSDDVAGAAAHHGHGGPGQGPRPSAPRARPPSPRPSGCRPARSPRTWSPAPRSAVTPVIAGVPADARARPQTLPTSVIPMPPVTPGPTHRGHRSRRLGTARHPPPGLADPAARLVCAPWSSCWSSPSRRSAAGWAAHHPCPAGHARCHHAPARQRPRPRPRPTPDRPPPPLGPERSRGQAPAATPHPSRAGTQARLTPRARAGEARRSDRTTRCSAAATRSASSSAAAAWPRCTSATTPGSRARWRSRCCAPTSPATPRSSPGSAVRPSRPPGSTTPPSSPSTTRARTTPPSPAAPACRCPYIVMEYVEGQTLRELLNDRLAARARRGGPHHRGRPRRPRLQPPHGHRPPRHQAGQRHDRPARRDQGDGLRHRPRRRRRQRHDDPDAGRHRHRPVPLAGAGPGPPRRRPLRPLLDRLPALRAAHRAAAVPGRLPGGHRLPARRAGPAASRRPSTPTSTARSTPSCCTRWPRTARPATRTPPPSAPTCRPPAWAAPSASRPRDRRRGWRGRRRGRGTVAMHTPASGAAHHRAPDPGTYRRGGARRGHHGNTATLPAIGHDPDEEPRKRRGLAYVLLVLAVLGALAAHRPGREVAASTGRPGHCRQVAVPSVVDLPVDTAEAKIRAVGLIPEAHDVPSAKESGPRRRPEPRGERPGEHGVEGHPQRLGRPEHRRGPGPHGLHSRGGHGSADEPRPEAWAAPRRSTTPGSTRARSCEQAPPPARASTSARPSRSTCPVRQGRGARRRGPDPRRGRQHPQ